MYDWQIPYQPIPGVDPLLHGWLVERVLDDYEAHLQMRSATRFHRGRLFDESSWLNALSLLHLAVRMEHTELQRLDPKLARIMGSAEQCQPDRSGWVDTLPLGLCLYLLSSDNTIFLRYLVNSLNHEDSWTRHGLFEIAWLLRWNLSGLPTEFHVADRLLKNLANLHIYRNEAIGILAAMVRFPRRLEQELVKFIPPSSMEASYSESLLHLFSHNMVTFANLDRPPSLVATETDVEFSLLRRVRMVDDF